MGPTAHAPRDFRGWTHFHCELCLRGESGLGSERKRAFCTVDRCRRQISDFGSGFAGAKGIIKIHSRNTAVARRAQCFGACSAACRENFSGSFRPRHRRHATKTTHRARTTIHKLEHLATPGTPGPAGHESNTFKLFLFILHNWRCLEN